MLSSYLSFILAVVSCSVGCSKCYPRESHTLTLLWLKNHNTYTQNGTKAKEGPYLACVQKIRYDNSKVCGQRYAVVVIADDVRDNY